MELKIVQQKKDLFEANFNIMQGDSVVGNIDLHGISFSMEANIDINYNGEIISLSPTKRKEVVQKTKGIVKASFFSNSHNSPYKTISNNQNGFVFLQCGSKALSFFHFQRYNDEDYYMYATGFGEKGIVAPVLKNNTYIGELYKESIVKDDLHIFNLYIENESDVIAFIIYAIYYYLLSYYKAGVKVTEGIKKDIDVTKLPERIELCNNSYYLNKNK